MTVLAKNAIKKTKLHLNFQEVSGHFNISIIQTSLLWERGSRGRGHMYTYGWLLLMFDRKQQNSVKQLSFN